MNTGRTLFAQIMDFIPLCTFHKCVERYKGNHSVKKFKCLDQYFSMAFAQLTYRESLRDLEVCLRTMKSKLYHMGIHSKVSRSTLAEANEKRDWRIYADFAQVLISEARRLYADDKFSVDLKETAYALDASTIDLCLSVFPWAKFRKTKAGVKLHTLLDLHGNIPAFMLISNAKSHDVNILDQLPIEAGAFYIMDRGYLDFKRLYHIQENSAYFVTRAKSNLAFKRRYSRPVDKATGLLYDQEIILSGYYPSQDYRLSLRRIGYRDPDTKKFLIFLTNNFSLPALTIAKLYKARWQVELFFKWIKQHLRIKAFFGTSENAVKTKIWIAISVYVLVSIVKKKLNLNFSLYTILQILSMSLFEKMPILQVLSESDCIFENSVPEKQLILLHI